MIKPESNEERLLLQLFKNNSIKINGWTRETDREGISSLTIIKVKDILNAKNEGDTEKHSY
jgi:hypothetical protein